MFKLTTLLFLMILFSGCKKSSDQGETLPPPAFLPFGQEEEGVTYRLTFSEEFEDSLHTGVWNELLNAEAPKSAKNYAVEDGSLKIWPVSDANGKFFDRHFNTNGKFFQQYGYFEMEAKLPYGKGTWPAFWLYSTDSANWRPEIDIMEAYAGAGGVFGDEQNHPIGYGITIWRGGAGDVVSSKRISTPDLSAGFHKYAVKWERTKQTFYFDGKEVFWVNIGMPRKKYILLSLQFGSASGQPDSTTPLGKENSYEISYVRAWQFP